MYFNVCYEICEDKGLEYIELGRQVNDSLMTVY